MMHLHWSTCVLLAKLLYMEIVILICFAAFVTVHTSVVKMLYVNSFKTIYDARQYCESHFYQGTLAGWEDIVDTNKNDVWDGNAYQLSSLIFIKDCTDDIGQSQHEIPANIHWSEAAAQCQALCDTNTFAIRGTSCHCLSDFYEPTNDLDCIPMLRQPPITNDTNSDAKTVFQTVIPEVDAGLSTTRCLAVTFATRCQRIEFRNCDDRLPMQCKAGTSITASWQEAGFACANANSFPKAPVLACTPGPAAWVGGFRSLQYAPVNGILGTHDPDAHGQRPWDDCYTFRRFPILDQSEDRFLGGFGSTIYSYGGLHGLPFNSEMIVSNNKFKDFQNTSIDALMKKQDVYLSVKTGGWKSLVYQAFQSIYSEPCGDMQRTRDPNIPDLLCRVFGFWDINNTPIFHDVSCTVHNPFYCRFIESGYNETCDVTQLASCDPDLVCIDRDGTTTCLCDVNEYRDVNNTICMTKKEFNQPCIPNLNDTCKTNLICASDVAVCACPENEYFDGIVTQSCFEINQYNATCPPGYDESCIGDLGCQEITEGESRCLCDLGALYLGTTCHNGSYAVAKIFNTPMTFYEASETCSSTSTYLADDINFESIFTDCFNDTVLFHAGIKQPDTSENQCTTVQLVNGSVRRDTCLTCAMTLPYVCIERVSECSDKICRISENVDTAHNKGEKGHSDPILGIVLACISAVCVAVALLVSDVCIKRRKRTKLKSVPAKENATFVNPYDSVKSCHPNGNHTAEEKKAGKDGECAVLGQKPEDETYSNARQHQQEGEYDTFAKPENDVTGIYDNMHNIKHLEEAEYAEIGSHRVPEITEDHTYSHMKHSKDAAEYDTFISIHKDTHNVLMESPYDALT